MSTPDIVNVCPHCKAKTPPPEYDPETGSPVPYHCACDAVLSPGASGWVIIAYRIKGREPRTKKPGL